MPFSMGYSPKTPMFTRVFSIIGMKNNAASQEKDFSVRRRLSLSQVMVVELECEHAVAGN
jgi:hypothetical protein